MKLTIALAFFVVLRSTWGYYDLGLTMQPDFQLYTVGGIGLFPSPIGRLLGALGPDIFAIISILASAVCVIAVALIARRCKLAPGLAATLYVISPASLYLSYAGIDAIGLALLLLSIAGVASKWLLPLSALTHLSLVPYVLVTLPRTLAAYATTITVTFTALAALLMTPYSGVIFGILHPDALQAMALGFLLGIGLSLPALFFVRRVPGIYYAALAIGVFECGVQHHLQARYLLPAAAIAATQVQAPAWLRVPRKAATLTAAIVAPVRQCFYGR